MRLTPVSNKQANQGGVNALKTCATKERFSQEIFNWGSILHRQTVGRKKGVLLVLSLLWFLPGAVDLRNRVGVLSPETWLYLWV